jgi:nitrite reductase (NADH) large subunit
MDVKETEPLVTVATEDEVLEVVAAFVQLYRENARYLHRIYKWVAKVGIDWCRAQVADPATRAALVGRFRISQAVYQTDPWAEHAARPADWAPVADLTLRAAE